MKKILILFFITLFFSYGFAQEKKCDCRIVKDYTAMAKKYDPDIGEQLKTVPYDQELWVRMKPAAQWNKCENKGCRLPPGTLYVADEYGLPIRVWSCGNGIITSRSYSLFGQNDTTEPVIASRNGTTIIINNNFPSTTSLERVVAEKNKQKLNNADLPVYVGGTYPDFAGNYGNQQPSSMNYPVNQDTVKSRNRFWGWFWPILGGVVITFFANDYLWDGEFDFNFTKPRQIIVRNPDIPGGPGHSPNAIVFNLF